MRRGALAGATALALLAAVAPAARAVAGKPTYRVGVLGAERTYEVYRTSNAVQRLALTVKIDNPPHELSTIASIGIVRRGKHWDIAENGYDEGYTGYTELGTGQPWLSTYGTPATLPACPNEATCRSSVDGSVTTHVYYTDYANYIHLERLWFFFDLIDATATVTIDSPGWRLRETKAVRFRRVLGPQVATGVKVMNREEEHFTEASLPGGRYGSFTRGHIPCWGGGVGKARLTGGIDEPAKSFTSPSCPPPGPTPFIDDPWSDDVAFGSTTWRLKGDVVGDTSIQGRLMVFDFPKPQ